MNMTNKEFVEKYTGYVDYQENEIKITDKESGDYIIMKITHQDLQDLKCLLDDDDLYTEKIKEKILNLFEEKNKSK